MAPLNVRTRKFIGMVALVVFLIVYALVVMAFAVRILPESSKLVEAVFYVAAGLAWTVPAGLLIKWMQRPDDDD